MSAIYQVLYEHPVTGIPVLHSWHETQEEAEGELEKQSESGGIYWIEQGTDYIVKRCESSGTIYARQRLDFYGFRAGIWCDECYDSDRCTVQKIAYSNN